MALKRSPKMYNSDWWAGRDYQVEGEIVPTPPDGGGTTPPDQGGGGGGGTGGAIAPNLVVTLVGTGKIGESTSVNVTGLGTPTASLAYQWTLSGTAVAVGGNTQNYTPQALDEGKTLNCTVVGTNSAGISAAAAVTGILITNPAPLILSAIVSPQVGRSTDTFSVTVNATANATLSYRWTFNNIVIPAAVAASLLPNNSGALRCEVTATNSGGTDVQVTDPVAVQHYVSAGLSGFNNVALMSGTLGDAPYLVNDQAMIVHALWEGPNPTSVTICGVQPGFPVGAVTVTEVANETVPNNKQFRAWKVTGFNSSKDITFSIPFPSNVTYGKVYGFQVAGFDLSNIGHTIGYSGNSADTVGVSCHVDVAGNSLALVSANRLNGIDTPPAEWTTMMLNEDPGSAFWDAIAGVVKGPFSGNLLFRQPTSVAKKMVLSTSLPASAVEVPTIYETLTFTVADPKEGKTGLLNVPASSSNTTDLTYQAYYNVSPLVPFGNAIVYNKALAGPAPVYTFTAADVGKDIVFGCLPTGSGQSGTEIFSNASGTILTAGVTPPTVMPTNKFQFEGTSVANGGIVTNGSGQQVQRADFTVKAGISVPSGKEICLLRSLTTTPDLQLVKSLTELGLTYTGAADVLWRSNGGAVDGAEQYGFVYLRDITAKTLTDGIATVDQPLHFTSVVAGTPIPPNPIPGFPPADQTLSSTTAASIRAAADARIASGSTADWIIDMPNGQVPGHFTMAKNLPGKTIFRAQVDRGAKFSSIDITGSTNVYFQRVDIDRTLGGAAAMGFRMAPCQKCGIMDSRIHLGPITPNSGKPGWFPNVSYGIEVNNSGTTNSNFITITNNALSGPANKHIYLNGCFDVTVYGNIGENVGDDFGHMGWGSRVTFENNWGPRAYWPDYDTVTGWAHNDFLQINSQTVNCDLIKYIGNCILMGPDGLQGNPRQGIFASKTKGTNWTHRNNIIISNSTHGITAVDQTSGMTLEKNTVLRSMDATGDQFKVKYQVGGTILTGSNVQCSNSGDTSMGANGLNIIVTTLAQAVANIAPYYKNTRMAATIFEAGPVAGAITDYNYGGAGLKQGATERWQDILVKKIVPSYGAARESWKRQYDPKNQILPA